MRLFATPSLVAVLLTDRDNDKLLGAKALTTHGMHLARNMVKGMKQATRTSGNGH